METLGSDRAELGNDNPKVITREADAISVFIKNELAQEDISDYTLIKKIDATIFSIRLYE